MEMTVVAVFFYGDFLMGAECIVIPAKAGIQIFLNWTPACAGVTREHGE